IRAFHVTGVQTCALPICTSYTWTGLENGQEYRVQVRARNQAPDPSDWSGWSQGEVPAGPPARPAAPQVQRVDDPVAEQITGSWQPPNNNGDAISEYRVTIQRDGARFKQFTTSDTSFQEDAPAGSDYTVSVAARNKAGWGETSPQSQSVRSFARPSQPGQPTATATGDSGEVQLEFRNSQPNGDTIRGYQVSINGGGWQSLRSDRTVQGLSNGSQYTFRVRAMNSYASPPSQASGAAVPYGDMGSASLNASRTQAREVTFSWSLPDGNGRDVESQQIRYRTNGGSWSGWSNINRQGSSTQGGEYSTTYEAEVRVVREDGQQRTAQASARTVNPPPPPDPSITLVRDRDGYHPPGDPDGTCTHSSCAYIDFRYSDLPAGNYRIEIHASQSTEGNPWRTYNAHLSGDGRWNSTAYRGNPGERV